MSKLSHWNDQALRLAGQVGDTIKDAVPDRALRWVETGAALGALKTGSRGAGKFVRRHPVALAAAAAGAGLLWYSLRQRAKRKANGTASDDDGVVEGRARRIEARRGRSQGSSSERFEREAGATQA